VNRGKYAYDVLWVKYALGKSSCGSKIAENNRFCVPIHFESNRFSFEKFPPQPPLLQPTIPWPPI